MLDLCSDLWSPAVEAGEIFPLEWVKTSREEMLTDSLRSPQRRRDALSEETYRTTYI